MPFKRGAIALVLIFPFGAFAQSMQGMDHGAHASDSMSALMAPMDYMMQDMADIESSGNPDADFLLMMIPHHQSAIDMAMVVLEQGEDAETADIARKIIEDQEREITQMKAALQELGIDLSDG
ncbi:hypothetical protein PARPLA_01172 [Rhodobacteraceae bacterium THAF1]|uniref:DUF305 domain-containing protein n=1 Tax=Palleronia sp. THAF1 TaxID=2587842 RepID=UPI000F4113C4|nr:DUF305 domain-containing protein [Palleronia sp. THAF1]QFU07305.1 hypothetical protein FIU81_01320 [Palleronia sp. THAF1]VDC20783.1 hypothetical protein PARPLA_01172 [Rhodobacteraceae bacterium THAF1]